ncbi:SigE family RNA polymerase sigma factor [Nocardioides dongxiaopingii]|uniref:SigE family RNA polymerase sigma factor n=1 Tax=Nocardioides TaxID=1839 RepID=UPI0010C77061|nr:MULTISPECIES: SigE family RNA polymerase sigma factor [Nocardioides]QCW51646.1 SigE family RNA polymerase sigma factor [Nocardioides sp. S-1144]
MDHHSDTDADFGDYARDAWSSLVRSAIFLGCTPHEAEDLAQTTLVRCYTAWPSVAGADNRAAYVYRMLLNCLRDSKRRRWWGERPTERLPDRPGHHGDADETARVDTADAVHRAMAGLSKPNRDVVVLRYFAGLTEKQTAAALSIPAGTVKSRLSRSLAQLAADDHLRDLGPGTDLSAPDLSAPNPSAPDHSEGATS